MHSLSLLSAALAVGSAAAATCKNNVQITTANQVIDCDVVEGDVIVSSKVQGALAIEGPKQIKGDLVIDGAKNLISLTSSSINAIGGTFQLHDLELLGSIDMQALRTVNHLNAVKLPQLSSLTFGKSGATKASNITVTDTFLSDLSGLNIASVDALMINTNPRLTMFNSDLVFINGSLIIFDNGNEMAINMTQLESAGDIQLTGVKSFAVPSLNTITAGLKFENNPELESFTAKNLSDFTGSVTFSNNNKLTKVSFPLIKTIQDGDITIQNNTKLEDLTGFPKLEKILGSMLLLGSFNDVSLPKLDYVKGAVKAKSTTSNSTFCDYFDNLDKAGNIAGNEECHYDTPNANTDGSGGKTSNGSSDSSGNKDDSGNAGIVSVNIAMFGLAAFAGLMQLL